jgi:hypothetical protein
MPRRRRSPLSLADLAHTQSQVVPPGQDDPDRALLGIPLDARLVRQTLAHPPDWHGYVWELVGTLSVDDAVLRWIWIDPAQLRQTPDATRLEVWAYRVYCLEALGWVEVRIQPSGELTRWVHREASGRTLDEDLAANTALERGWELLRTLAPSGRPKGSGPYADRDTFLRDLTTAIQYVKHTDRHPSYARVAPHVGLGMSARHLQRLFSHHVTLPTGVNWRAFVAAR